MYHRNKKFALGQLFLCFERRYIPHLHKSENNSKRSKKTKLVSDLDFLLAIFEPKYRLVAELHFSKETRLVKHLFD
jgi:hypothetical protein